MSRSKFFKYTWSFVLFMFWCLAHAQCRKVISDANIDSRVVLQKEAITWLDVRYKQALQHVKICIIHIYGMRKQWDVFVYFSVVSGKIFLYMVYTPWSIMLIKLLESNYNGGIMGKGNKTCHTCVDPIIHFVTFKKYASDTLSVVLHIIIWLCLCQLSK